MARDLLRTSPALARGLDEGSGAARLDPRLAVSAVVDQALSAATVFMVLVLLGRWMAPAQYAAFAVGYGLFRVAGVLHAALLSEPMLVYGRRAFAQRLPQYARWLLRRHLTLSGALGLGLAGVALALWAGGRSDLGYATAALAAATPLLLLSPLARRACYLCGIPGVAVSGGALQLALACVALLSLHRWGHVSVFTAVATMAGASAAGTLWIALRLRPVPLRGGAEGVDGLAAASHREYGHWAAVLALVNWLPWNVHFLILSSFRSPTEVAALQALYNVLLPIIHFMIAIANVALPTLASQLASPWPERARLTVGRTALLCVATAALYTAFVAVVGSGVLHLVYDGRYAAVYWLAPLAAAIQIPAVAVAMTALAQRADGRSDRAVVAWLPHALLSLILGSVGGARWGVAGAVLGMLAASVLAALLVLATFAWRAVWRSERGR